MARNAQLSPDSAGAGVPKSVSGFVAQIRFGETKKCWVLRSQNKRAQGFSKIIRFFLEIANDFERLLQSRADAIKCLACSERRNWVEG
jgi:hypothetical protein